MAIRSVVLAAAALSALFAQPAAAQAPRAKWIQTGDVVAQSTGNNQTTKTCINPQAGYSFDVTSAKFIRTVNTDNAGGAQNESEVESASPNEVCFKVVSRPLTKRSTAVIKGYGRVKQVED